MMSVTLHLLHPLFQLNEKHVSFVGWSSSTHRWPWQGCTKTPMPWEEHITKVIYVYTDDSLGGTLSSSMTTHTLLFMHTHACTHRPPWHTEWNGQYSGGHPAVTGHVPWDQEAVLSSVLLPLQWWPPGDPWSIQEPWGGENTYWLKHNETYCSLWWVCYISEKSLSVKLIVL